MMTTPEQRELIERYLAAYNCFDCEGMLGTLHEAIEFETVVAGEVMIATQGKAAFRALAEQGAALFSTRHQTITA